MPHPSSSLYPSGFLFPSGWAIPSLGVYTDDAQHPVGRTLTTECEFTVGGVLSDVSSISCIVRPPNAGPVSHFMPDIYQVAPGLYAFDFVASAVGPWWIRWETLGLIEAVAETSVLVVPSVVQ